MPSLRKSRRSVVRRNLCRLRRCKVSARNIAGRLNLPRALAVEALRLENEISCLVNEAYGLTPEEIALMWETAPPRMPVAKPT